MKLVYLLPLVAQVSWGLSQEAQQILSRENRSLGKPPRTLSSDPQGRARMPQPTETVPAESVEEPIFEKGGQEIPRHRMSDDEKEQQKNQYFSSRESRKSGRYTGFKGERVFGIGFVAAGSYGVFGTEADLAIGEGMSAGLGFGTGMSYSTWSLYGRMYLKESSTMNTFFQAGYANWYMGRISVRGNPALPEYLTERFFKENGRLSEGARSHLVYPSLGMLYQTPTGLAFTAFIQYFIRVTDFSGALYGGAGTHFYF